MGFAEPVRGHGAAHQLRFVPGHRPAISDKQDCGTFFNWNTSAGFKSRHPGGAHFVLADGSVHFISENIDYRNYQRLGDRRDGEAVEPF